MDIIALDIMEKKLKDIKDIENRFIAKELDEMLDESFYIKTLEKHILMLEILNEYYKRDQRDKDMNKMTDTISRTLSYETECHNFRETGRFF